MIIQNSTDIKTEYFLDRNGDPSPVDVQYERHVINPNGLVQLRNIPSIHTVFNITTKNGVEVVKYNKVDEIINQTDFTVDYPNGLLTFHSSQINKEIQVSYTNAIGRLSISSDRIFTKIDNQGNIVQTLNTLIEEGMEVLSDLEAIGGANKIINELKGYVESVKGLSTTIIEGSNTNNTLKRTNETAKTTNSTLNSAVASANNKMQEMTEWVNKNGDVVNLNNRVTTTEGKLNTVSASLEQKASKSEIGTPLVASSVSGMTDKTKVYVNTTDGKWYSWNGTNWIVGGTYNSQGIGDGTITLSKLADEVKNATPTWVKSHAKSNSGIKLIYVEKIFDIEPYRTQLTTVQGYTPEFTFYHNDNIVKTLQAKIFINSSNAFGNIANARGLSSTDYSYVNGTLYNFSHNCGYYETTDARYIHVLIAFKGETDLQFVYSYFKNFKLKLGNIEITANDSFAHYLCDINSKILLNQYVGYELINAKGVENITRETKQTVDALSSDVSTLKSTVENLEIGVAPTQWTGAKYDSFGDSITWQDAKAYNGGQQNGQIAVGYQTLLKQILGFDSYVNYGESGATTIQVIEQFRDKSDRNYDIATFFFGTNDFMKHVALGQRSDTSTTTFYGALRFLCNKIVELKPNKPVLFITPLQRWGYVYEGKATTLINDEGVALEQYVNAIKEVCGEYGFPVVDLYHNSQINRWNIGTYTKDGLHPIDIGYVHIAYLIKNSIVGVGRV